MIILGLDGLEMEYVKKFRCKNLMQRFFVKTNITMFSQPRTVVIWSSFLTGKSKEKEILEKTDKKTMWNYSLDVKETFFSSFNKVGVVDVVGFNYRKKLHKMERGLLKDFFVENIQEDEYEKLVFDIHAKNKK